MEAKSFVYWLQGYLEIRSVVAPNEGLTAQQVRVIGNHLNLVFKHEIDPSIGGDQAELQAVHDGKPAKEPTYCASPQPTPVFDSPLFCGKTVEPFPVPQNQSGFRMNGQTMKIVDLISDGPIRC